MEPSLSGQPRGHLRRVGTGLVLGALVACGCAGTKSVTVQAETGEQTRRDTRIEHESCDVDSASADKQDVNGDGRPDLVTVGGTRGCQAADLNFDGSWDSYVYRNADGSVRRRESDFDRDGRIDEISTFRGGALIARQRATRLDGQLDTWHFYEQGRLTRTERDSDGDAVIDQWWEYPRQNKLECPLVHSDVDGDGRPDPGATVDMCPPDETAPPEPDDPKPDEGSAFDEEKPSDLQQSVSDEPQKASPDQATEASPKSEGGKQ